MGKDIAIVLFRDSHYGTFAIQCKPENSGKVAVFIGSRYPDWSKACEGMAGATPWNNVLDVLPDMSELLDDELVFIHGASNIRVVDLG